MKSAASSAHSSAVREFLHIAAHGALEESAAMRILVAVLSLLVAASASAAGPYRCGDRYQDIPCSGGLSPAEIEAIQQAKRKADDVAAAKRIEEHRLRMLLEAYPSPAKLQAARAVELQPQVDRRRQISAREDELRRRQAKLMQDAEFYIPLRKPLPPALKSAIDGVDAELAAQTQARQNLDQTDAVINRRYDGMQADLQPLWHPAPAHAVKKQ